ncbi:hypothetical protein QEG41_004648 [Pluralibacter gergoviae]
MLNPTTWNLFTLALTGRAAETAPGDLRLLAAVGDEARNDYLRGLGAIGNIIFWACENENYTDHKADLPALGAFLKHTADMARAAEFMAGHLGGLAGDEEFDTSNLPIVPSRANCSAQEGNEPGEDADLYAQILNEVKRS